MNAIFSFQTIRGLLILAVSVLICVPVLAQEGSVVYEERIRIDIELPPEMQHMRSQIPTEHTARRQLLFSGERSLWRPVPQEAEQLEMETGRSMMMMRFGGSGRDVSETFTDREANVQLEHLEFLGRTFLISDTVNALPWRLTGERAEFRGYMTMQATAATSDTTSVEAWFTPEIQASVGPGRFGGLPGLILMLTVDGGRRSYVAQEISFEAPDPSALRAPTQGRRVTREEFAALMEERMREMGVQGRGRMRMQIMR